MPDLRNLKCVECGQTEESMLVFVGSFRYEDGTIEELPEGMHPYCDPCREKLNISDELNVGRDLRAESRQVTLDAVNEAQRSDGQRGVSLLMEALDDWIGSTDGLFAMMGRPAPSRPQEVFDGVNDALGELDPADMQVRVTLALISVCNTVEDRLPNWKNFVRRAHEHYQKICPEEADSLLKGFL
jgi:hypothetical protein